MAEEELHVVRLRNDFYRDGINKVFIALSIVAAVIVLLALTFFYLQVQKPKPIVFATDNAGRVFAPVPIDRAFVKEADLVQWLNDSITQSFRFDFVSMKDEMDRMKALYTDNGYAKLTALFNSYANPEQVQARRLFVNARVSGVPTLFNQGIVSGRYTWIFHFPIEVSFTSADRTSTTTLPLEVTVVRTQVDDELAGLAIDDITVVKEQQQNAAQG